jgi:hypothetical protein
MNIGKEVCVLCTAAKGNVNPPLHRGISPFLTRAISPHVTTTINLLQDLLTGDRRSQFDHTVEINSPSWDKTCHQVNFCSFFQVECFPNRTSILGKGRPKIIHECGFLQLSLLPPFMDGLPPLTADPVQ